MKELDPGEHILRIRLHERNLYSSSGHFLNPTEDDVDCVICAGVKNLSVFGEGPLALSYVCAKFLVLSRGKRAQKHTFRC